MAPHLYVHCVSACTQKFVGMSCLFTAQELCLVVSGHNLLVANEEDGIVSLLTKCAVNWCDCSRGVYCTELLRSLLNSWGDEPEA